MTQGHAPSPLGWPSVVSHGSGLGFPNGGKGAPSAFISELGSSTVEIYSQKGHGQSPTGSITNGVSSPVGEYIDSKGNLYVANEGTSTISYYKKGQTSPSNTLNPGCLVLSVAVNSKGTVFAPCFDSGTIEVFTAGSSSPTSTLTEPNGNGYNATVDKEDDIFVDDYSLKVVEFKGGSGSGTDVGSITFQFPGGMAFDKKDTLIVCDQGNGSTGTISAYKKPWTGGASYTIGYNGDITGCQLDVTDKNLWAGNYGKGEAEVYQNKNNGSMTDAITTGSSSPWDAALSPPTKP